MIVIIVVSVVAVLGGGACVFGLVLLGASAEPEATAEPSAPGLAGTVTSTPTSTAAAANDPPAAPDPGAATPAPPANAGSPGGKAVTPMWFCNATGIVNVCGFAGACSMQNVFGVGSGPDRFLAQNSAKMACEGMARAKGASTVCAVSCSVATKR